MFQTDTIPQTDTDTIYRNYHGGYFKTLVSPEENNNAFALIEMVLPKGAEPPRHVHAHEDETFYILEGTVSFTIGNSTVIAGHGDTVFAPRNIPHHFNIHSRQARFLNLINPGDFWHYFMEFSSPCFGEPAVATKLQAPTPPQIEHMLHVLAVRYQLKLA